MGQILLQQVYNSLHNLDQSFNKVQHCLYKVDNGFSFIIIPDFILYQIGLQWTCLSVGDLAYFGFSYPIVCESPMYALNMLLSLISTKATCYTAKCVVLQLGFLTL